MTCKNRHEPRVTEAAVLVPVYRGVNGALRLVLVRRSATGVHGGELALPGGKRDAGDGSLRETALRETREEIGLSGEGVRILEELPGVDTVSTGFMITPFLGVIVPPSSWTLAEDEIAELLDIELTELTEPGACGEETRQYPGWPQPQRISFYRIGRYKLWGATYRIIHPLIPRLAGGEWKI